MPTNKSSSDSPISNIPISNINYDTQPPHLYPEYKSTILRSPTRPLVPVAVMLKDLSLPAFGESAIGKYDNDLTKNARINADPIGERIRVGGKVMDENGRPLKNVLVEIWQANSAGRYIHKEEIHDAPLEIGRASCRERVYVLV